MRKTHRTFQAAILVMLILPTNGLAIANAKNHSDFPSHKKLGNLRLDLNKLPAKWSVDTPSVYDGGGGLSRPAAITSYSIRFRRSSDSLRVKHSSEKMKVSGKLWPDQEYVSVDVEEITPSASNYFVPYGKLINQRSIIEQKDISFNDKTWSLRSYVNSYEKYGGYSVVDYLSDDVLDTGEAVTVCRNFGPLKPIGKWPVLPDKVPVQAQVECRIRLKNSGVYVGVVFSSYAWRQTPEILTVAIDLVSAISGRTLTPN